MNLDISKSQILNFFCFKSRIWPQQGCWTIFVTMAIATEPMVREEVTLRPLPDRGRDLHQAGHEHGLLPDLGLTSAVGRFARVRICSACLDWLQKIVCLFQTWIAGYLTNENIAESNKKTLIRGLWDNSL